MRHEEERERHFIRREDVDNINEQIFQHAVQKKMAKQGASVMTFIFLGGALTFESYFPADGEVILGAAIICFIMWLLVGVDRGVRV